MAKTATWRKTPFAHKFYHSKAWATVRAFVWDRSHGLCERCAERGEMKPADVVHHTTPLNPDNVNDPDVALNPDRLLALCDECHTEVHKELGIGAFENSLAVEPRVGFDENGNVVRLER